ncbi:lysylphosphatidylglycerol synthase transmembrane domain-containing protein [Roseibacillus persicicus]|uniref:lysylphosphatidylglycerol synthase transmembrane domain-containing protein n=1 Tax=Roseibacillus persicicus TaxID=454148 RepID=UPI00280D9D3E|nr:lysylphosphatidylglycerol synthase domain-containing protein [Roseibacillus persicicus]MDQ8190122.1 lysylphosphatidylglycerol synthase domain-containing protein [Roseibacillus persicicus]
MKAILKRLKPFCFFAVLAFMAWGLWALREQLGEALASANHLMLLGAGLLAAVYLFLNASVWGVILRLVGIEVSRWRAARLWIECESMRWLPGGVWGYASRVVEAKQVGAAKGPAALSLAVELALTVAAWASLGLVGTLLSPQLRAAGLVYLERFQIPPTGFFLVVGLGILAAGIVLFLDLFKLRTRIYNASREILRGLMQWRITLRAYCEYLALSLFYGVGFLLCLQAIGVDPLPSLLDAAGSYGLAWIVGFLAFGAPGGMGVREGVLYLVFAPLGIGAEVATAAILWRAIQIVVELLLLAVIKACYRKPVLA